MSYISHNTYYHIWTSACLHTYYVPSALVHSLRSGPSLQHSIKACRGQRPQTPSVFKYRFFCLMLIHKYLTIINFYSISILPNYQSNLYPNSIYIYYSNLLSPLHLLSNTTYSINLILKYTSYLLPLSSSKFYSSEYLT